VGADRGAGVADAGSPRLPRGRGDEVAQQGRKTDAARLGLRLQLVAHVVVKAN
jgi:hypothetical protein